MIEIKVDAREKDLYSHIEQKMQANPNDSLKLTSCSLDIGDIIFCKDDKEILIIERKKVTDLAASIKDGRYKEQSYRLNGHPLPNHNIVYMIEGNLNQARMDKNTLNSCIFSLNFIKGFSIWKTTNLEDSAIFLLNSAKYLSKGSEKVAYYQETMEGKETTEKDYINVVKTAKKENVTPNNIGEIMLSQIPGISANVAKCVINHFNCIVNLIADLQERGEECLLEVKVPFGNDSHRKLNKTCISNLQKYLTDET